MSASALDAARNHAQSSAVGFNTLHNGWPVTEAERLQWCRNECEARFRSVAWRVPAFTVRDKFEQEFHRVFLELTARKEQGE